MSISTRKRLLAALIAIVFTVATAKAQAPQKMSFQSVVRNSSGVLVANHSVGLRLSILQGSINGTAVYVETQTATSNANGLVTLQIGGGTVVSGTFSSIDWSAGPYYIKSEIDPTGGTSYGVVGTTQLLSVAYALYSNTAGTLSSSTGSGAHMALYTVSDTFTVPSGVNSVIVELWGAGGGGLSTWSSSGGGGGGGYGKSGVSVTSGQKYYVTVGTGGTPDNNGGNSSFGNLLIATGGSGGANIHGTCNTIITGYTSSGSSNGFAGQIAKGCFDYGYGDGGVGAAFGNNAGTGANGLVIVYW